MCYILQGKMSGLELENQKDTDDVNGYEDQSFKFRELASCTSKEETIENQSERRSCDSSTFDQNALELEEIDAKFKNKYSLKLEKAAEISSNQIELLENRIKILQEYNNDLKDYNNVLLLSLKNLESETQTRVGVLESKLYRAANVSKAYMKKVSSYEHGLSAALASKSRENFSDNNLCNQLKAIQEDNLTIRDHYANLRHDCFSLIKIIQNARLTGTWQIDNVTFCDLTFEDIYGSSKTLSPYESQDSLNFTGYPLDHGQNIQTDTLKPITMFNLQGSSINEVDNFKKDFSNMRLQMDLRAANRSNEVLHNELCDKHKIICDLESKITDLHHQLNVKDTEVDKCENFIQNLKQDARNTSVKMFQLNEEVKRLSENLHQVDHPLTPTVKPLKCKTHINSADLIKPVIKEINSDDKFFNEDKANDSGIINDGNLLNGIDNHASTNPLNEYSECSSVHKANKDDIKRYSLSKVRNNNLFIIKINFMKKFFKELEKFLTLPVKDSKIFGNDTNIGKVIEKHLESILQNCDLPSVSCDTYMNPAISSAYHSISSGDRSELEEFQQLKSDILKLFSFDKIDDVVSVSVAKKDIAAQTDEMFGDNVDDDSKSSAFRTYEPCNMHQFATKENHASSADLSSDSKCSSSNKVDLRTRIENMEHQLLRAKDEELSKSMLISQLQSHLTTSCNEVELKTTTLFNIEAKLQKARDDNKSLNSKISNLFESVTTKENEIQSLNELNSYLQSQLNTKDEAISQFKNLEADLQSQKQLLMTQLDERGTQLYETQNDNSILVKKLEERELEFQNMMLTIKNLQQAVLHEKKLVEDAKEEVRQKQLRLQGIQEEFEESQSHCKKSIDELTNTKKELESLQSEKDVLIEEIEELQAEIKCLESCDATSKDKVSPNDDEEKKIEDAIENRIKDLEEQLFTGKKLVEDLHNELVKMQVVIKQQDQDMTLAKQDLASKLDEIDHLENINTALRKELRMIDLEHSPRRESVDENLVEFQQHTDDYGEKTPEISVLEKRLSLSQDNLTMKSLEVLSLRSENSILKEDLNVIKAEVDNLKKSNVNSSSITQLMSELLEIKNEFEEERIERIKKEEEWEKLIVGLNNSIESEKNKSQELENHLRQSEKESNERRLKILEYELHMKQHKQKSEVLEAAEGYLQVKLSQLHQQLIDTRAKLNSKEDSLKMAEKQMEKKEQELQTAFKKKDEYLLWNHSLQQQISELNTENKLCRDNVHQVMVRLCNGEQVLRGHEKLMADLRDELDNKNWSSEEEISSWNE